VAGVDGNPDVGSAAAYGLRLRSIAAALIGDGRGSLTSGEQRWHQACLALLPPLDRLDRYEQGIAAEYGAALRAVILDALAEFGVTNADARLSAIMPGIVRAHDPALRARRTAELDTDPETIGQADDLDDLDGSDDDAA
jgi:hypothetical protein